MRSNYQIVSSWWSMTASRKETDGLKQQVKIYLRKMKRFKVQKSIARAWEHFYWPKSSLLFSITWKCLKVIAMCIKSNSSLPWTLALYQMIKPDLVNSLNPQASLWGCRAKLTSPILKKCSFKLMSVSCAYFLKSDLDSQHKNEKEKKNLE